MLYIDRLLLGYNGATKRLNLCACDIWNSDRWHMKALDVI